MPRVVSLANGGHAKVTVGQLNFTSEEVPSKNVTAIHKRMSAENVPTFNSFCRYVAFSRKEILD
jgi:hypothetical protein